MATSNSRSYSARLSSLGQCKIGGIKCENWNIDYLKKLISILMRHMQSDRCASQQTSLTTQVNF